MKNAFVRVFTTKAGKKCTALVVKYGEDKETMFFSDAVKFMSLLNLKPTDYFDLPNGDYEIV